MTQISVITDIKSKQETRPLYEQAFADPKGFVDYYYSEKTKDNIMVTSKKGGAVISMLHMNPYTIVVNGREAPVYYIVAVATDRAYRRQGYMAAVLERAFLEMEKEEIPFCFLLPVDEAIYTDFGFETICPFVMRSDRRSLVSYEEVQRNYEVYCKRDALYEKRKRMEDSLADEGDTELLPQNPVIMARIVNREACGRLFGLPAAFWETDEAKNNRFESHVPNGTAANNSVQNRKLLDILRQKRCYFREEV